MRLTAVNGGLIESSMTVQGSVIVLVVLLVPVALVVPVVLVIMACPGHLSAKTELDRWAQTSVLSRRFFSVLVIR